MNKPRITAFIFFVFVWTMGCGYQKAFSPAEPKGFIERKEDGLVSEKLPFQYVWMNTKQSKAIQAIKKQGNYKLYIEPVSTELLNYDGKDQSLDDRAEAIARYLRDKIITEVKAYDGWQARERRDC